MVGMGLMEWVALGYAVLLAPASLIAGSLCRIARLSGRHVENDRREVVPWGSIPIASNTGVSDGHTHPRDMLLATIDCNAHELLSIRRHARPPSKFALTGLEVTDGYRVDINRVRQGRLTGGS